MRAALYFLLGHRLTGRVADALDFKKDGAYPSRTVIS